MPPLSKDKGSFDGCIAEFARYDLTLQLTLAMRHFISKNCKRTIFVLPEIKLQTTTGEKLPPIDFLIESGDIEHLHALPCEVKASISTNNQQAIEELSRLMRYSHPLERIIDELGTVRKYSSQCVVLILHQRDSDRILRVINDAIGTQTLRLPTDFCLWDFGVTSSPKVGEGDVILVKTKSGSTGCSELDTAIADSIVVPREAFSDEYETIKFTPLKPPLVYTLTMLWHNIFTYLSKGERILSTDANTVTTAARDYYGTWDDKSPIRSDWIRECLDALCTWGIAAKEKETYKIDLQKPKGKDLKKYFCEKMSGEKTVFGGELEKEQKVLSEYSNRSLGVISEFNSPDREDFD